MSFLITLFTVFLVLVGIFLILIILMQKAKSDGGLGAAMGGGAAESAFGADTNTVLRKGTIYCTVLFFVLSFGLYLAHQHQRYQAERPTRELEEITPAGESGDGAEGAVPPGETEGMIELPEPVETTEPESAEPEESDAAAEDAGEDGETGAGRD